MVEVEILGVVLGECRVIKTGGNHMEFNFFNPNEEMYKIFPDFPKEFSEKNTLVFNFISGRIYFNHDTFMWDTIYEKYFYLDNFKGEENA